MGEKIVSEDNKDDQPLHQFNLKNKNIKTIQSYYNIIKKSLKLHNVIFFGIHFHFYF